MRTSSRSSGNWLGKQKKEILLLLFGATISFIASVVTMYLDKSGQKRKEFRDKREAYLTSYFKELNQKLNSFEDLVDEIAAVNESKSDSDLIVQYKQKLEDARTNSKVNFYYNKVQFTRFFDSTTYVAISKIDAELNEYAQVAEAGGKEYVESLKLEEGKLSDKILAKEKELFDRIDKDE